MDRVKNKVAIITGASMGIGKATAILLAKEGAKIAVTDINQEEGEKVVREIKDLGGIAKFWMMNTAKEAEVEKTFKNIFEEFSLINILVNNAGVSGVNKPTDEVSESEWDLVNSINVKGVFFCTKHVIPYMRKANGGSIINLSSIYGLVGAPDIPPYHASKGAVRLMSKTDALLFAKDKIRVNSVHPGCILTPLVEKLAASVPGGKQTFLDDMTARHPIGHIGEPDDIAYGILYLASDESKFVTGIELTIDGGYTAQ